MKVLVVRAGEEAYLVVKGEGKKLNVREIQSSARKLTAQLGGVSERVRKFVLRKLKK